MSDGWNQFSEDGKRMVTVAAFGYAIYSLKEGDDPKAETRDYVHRGIVGEFVHAEQWLKDGNVQGPVVQIYTPKTGAKVKVGAP